MDFTIRKYRKLLLQLSKNGYSFQTFADFIKQPAPKVIILRHDVDKKPNNSLLFAKIQYELGIRGSYYFRVVPESYDEKIITQIASMGHEIGYHYETMDTSNGNIEKAYHEFLQVLEKFRKVSQIETICMHGSPLSSHDNRAIWQKYNYKDIGLIGEPYFDLNFENVYYLTDTGRRFDGDKVSVRDKPMQTVHKKWPVYHSSNEILQALLNNSFPQSAMITFHPQRWTTGLWPWLFELIWQNVKNIIKKNLINLH